jgi:hypothetical protein
MHKPPPDHTTPTRIKDTSRSPEQREHSGPGLLSHSDPEPEPSIGRPPTWLIIIFVLLVTGFVVLHLTGVFGP